MTRQVVRHLTFVLFLVVAIIVIDCLNTSAVVNVLDTILAVIAGGILFADWPRKRFDRTVTLYDGPDTREKFTVMDKWDVIIDDERNPDFEGLEEFLEWGASYRLTIEKV
jgi:hypothetical protein